MPWFWGDAMTDFVRLTDLPAAATLADSDLLPLVQSGNGAKLTIGLLKALIGAGTSSGLSWSAIPTGTTVAVDAGRQMMVFNSLTLDGSLVVDGSVGVWS